MLDLTPFQGSILKSGHVLAEVQLTAKPLLDPLNRAATAQTVIRGNRLSIYLKADLDEEELSISLYHEVLEAVSIASERPPERVMNFNEGDFENAARKAHLRFGVANLATLNRMLADFGF